MGQNIGILANIQTPNLGIGNKGDLLYHLPEDLKMFKELTVDQVVIMGRKTWESLPPKARPLPNRINIIVTSQIDLIPISEQVIVASTPEEALILAQNTFPKKNIWVIGGAGIYEALLDRCDQLCLTEVAGNLPADTYFPEFRNHFTLIDTKEYTSIKNNTPFQVRIYERLHV